VGFAAPRKPGWIAVLFSGSFDGKREKMYGRAFMERARVAVDPPAAGKEILSG